MPAYSPEKGGQQRQAKEDCSSMYRNVADPRPEVKKDL
jgi:hypothetical protein